MKHDFILLDRSGSMAEHGLWVEAKAAVNDYVKELAAKNVDTGVTLVAFDHDQGHVQFDVLRDRIIPKTWKPISDEDATPRGMTPLCDAVGRLVTLARAGNYDNVAIIIMTDGLENMSRELSPSAAKALLDECRAKGWVVVFLGANFDNAMQAAQLGNAPAYTAQSSVRNLRGTMAMTAGKRADYAATGTAATMSFTDEEKAQAKQQ